MPLSSSTTSAGRAPYAGDAFKTEVTRAAQTAGLAISRLQGGEAGRFSLVFEQADIRDRAALDRVFANHQPDAVMHLAAESHVDRSIDSIEPFISTNIDNNFA